MGKLSVALQAYSIRDFAEKDLPGTLRQVKEMGYDTLELAGMYGMTPAALKAVLDEAGLTALSAHVPLPEYEADAEATVKRYKEAGCTYLAIPWLPPELCPDGPEFDRTLAAIDKIGRLCRANGLTLLYHNHDFEFRKMPDGAYGLDYLYGKVSADLLQTEIDTCWVKFAGLDPAAYIRKYAGRCPIVHLKDFVAEGKNDAPYALIGADAKAEKSRGNFEFRPVGHGCQDFPAIINAAAESGAAWIIVEQDMSVGRASLEAARMSRDYLRTLGY